MTDHSLRHHGVKGMHWGIRRYQYANGTLTPEGARHYARKEGLTDKQDKLTAAGYKRLSNTVKKNMREILRYGRGCAFSQKDIDAYLHQKAELDAQMHQFDPYLNDSKIESKYRKRYAEDHEGADDLTGYGGASMWARDNNIDISAIGEKAANVRLAAKGLTSECVKLSGHLVCSDDIFYEHPDIQRDVEHICYKYLTDDDALDKRTRLRREIERNTLPYYTTRGLRPGVIIR